MCEGPKGVFMVPGMEIFFRRLGEAFCADGAFRLTFIEVAAATRRGHDRVRFGGTSYLYNSAFDRSWGNLAPGMVLVGEDIRLAIEDGCGVRPAEGRLRVQVPVRRGAARRQAAGCQPDLNRLRQGRCVRPRWARPSHRRS